MVQENEDWRVCCSSQGNRYSCFDYAPNLSTMNLTIFCLRVVCFLQKSVLLHLLTYYWKSTKNNVDDSIMFTLNNLNLAMTIYDLKRFLFNFTSIMTKNIEALRQIILITLYWPLTIYRWSVYYENQIKNYAMS